MLKSMIKYDTFLEILMHFVGHLRQPSANLVTAPCR